MSKFIAHRGLSKQYLENTLQAFDGAWQADCAGIELDIQVSKDGQVLVIHDPDTARVSQTKLTVADSDWIDLQKIVLRSSDNETTQTYKITKLQDVIAKVPTDKIVQIEIKHHIDNDAGMDAVLDVLATMRNDISVQIISFDVSKLAKVKQACPHLCCLYLLPEEDMDLQMSCELAVNHAFDGMGMHHQFVSADTVAYIKAKELLLDVWTVNDVTTAQKILDLGVDFIASDVADEMNTFFNKNAN